MDWCVITWECLGLMGGPAMGLKIGQEPEDEDVQVLQLMRPPPLFNATVHRLTTPQHLRNILEVCIEKGAAS